MSELEPLIGEWRMEAFGQTGGRVTFEWLGDGPFVVQRWTVEYPAAPDGIAILEPGRQHYFDERGVARVYEMSLGEGEWRLYRESDDPFWQRFIGRFSPDGREIAGAWERSDDGREWQLDFELRYVRSDA